MQTVHAIGSRDLGGAERFFARLVGELTGRGHETAAVVRRGPMVGGAYLDLYGHVTPRR